MTTAEAEARGPSTRARARTAVGSIPIWGWVAAIVTGSALVRFLAALSVHAAWIFQDEIVYSDLARSLGRTGHFALRQSVGRSGFGPVYPILLAPAYALFSSVPDAYLATKAINAVVMSLAAVPVYLIARRVLSPKFAVGAAALSVAIPSMAYTSTLLSENAFYPAVMATMAAIVAIVERPTLVRQLAFFGFLIVAFYTRAQGVMLLPVLVLAIAAVVATDAAREQDWALRTLARRLDAFRITWIVLLAGGIGVVALQLARGRSLGSILGVYQGVTSSHYTVAATARWFLWHIGEIDMYVGVLPFAALILVAILAFARSNADRPLAGFASAAVALTLSFGVTAAAFASQPAGLRVEERYFFYVAPFMLIALLVWIERRIATWPAAIAVAAAAAAALPGTIPFPSVVTSDNVHDTMAFVPLLRLELRHVAPDRLAAIIVLAALAGAVLFAVLPVRWRLVGLAAVLLWFAFVERSEQLNINQASRDALHAGIRVDRSWIDRRVGASADAAILAYGGTTALPYWENEFFNGSLKKIYNLGSIPYDSLPMAQVTAQPSGALVAPDRRPARARYVAAYFTVRPRGRLLAADEQAGMRLYRTAGPIAVKDVVYGIYPDRWSGAQVSYTRYACRGGTVTATLLSDRDLHPQPLTIVASNGSKDVARFTYRPGLVARHMTVPLTPSHGVCAVTFTVPVAVPQLVTGSADTRQLGVRFLRFAYRPTGAGGV
jgi:hypothetical protein